MKIVILGCGRVGGLLAGLLDDGGHEVTIVDLESKAFEMHLPGGFRGNTVLGDGMDADVLRSAGLDGADAFIALTQGDNRNIMAAQIAREIFGVKRVLCKINDPIRAQTYRSRGLETWSRTTILTEIIRELLFKEESLSGALLERAQRMEAKLSGDMLAEGAE